MPEIIHLLIWLLIIGAVFAVLYWAITQIPLPPPFDIVIRVILAIVVVIVALEFLLPLAGPFPSLR